MSRLLLAIAKSWIRQKTSTSSSCPKLEKTKANIARELAGTAKSHKIMDFIHLHTVPKGQKFWFVL